MKTKNLFLLCLNSIMLFFISVLCCVINTWDNVTLNEIIFHMQHGVNGTSPRIIVKFIFFILFPQSLFFILFFLCKISLKKATWPIVASFILSLSYFIYNSHKSIEYISLRSQASSFIEDNYINPGDVNITFKCKRNLIHIYLESMESSFTNVENGGIFPENLIPNLTKLAHDNVDFSGTQTKLNGARPFFGTTWTAAGIFAQSGGVPLNLGVTQSTVRTQNSFYPGLVMLGDILLKNGYQQTFLLGSCSGFAAKNRLFIDHGNFDIIDYDVLHSTGAIPKGYHIGWGIEDRKLLGIAKSTLQRLSQQGKPFNFVLLTVDTHTPDSYIDATCEKRFNDDYQNSLYCSDSQIGEFVEWIKKQDFYKETTIVLTGDHLTRQTGFIKDNSEYVRKAYSCYINSVHNDFKDHNFRLYSLFDHFPTILSAIGAEIPGNRLGLGTNLFSEEQTLSEQYGYEFQERELQKRSTFLETLGKIDKTDIYQFNDILLQIRPKQCAGAIEFIEYENQQDKKIANFGGWVLHSQDKKQVPPSILLLRARKETDIPDKFASIEKISRPDLGDTLRLESNDEIGFAAFVPCDHVYYIGYRYENVIYKCDNLKITGDNQ